MTTLKPIVKSIPGVPRLVRYLQRRFGLGFYTLSPDALVALVRAFNIQKSQLASGRNLFDGYGYYEFGLFLGFSFWFAEQISREYTGSSFRLFGFDSFEGLPKPELAPEAAAFKKGDFRGSYEDVTANLKKRHVDFSRIRLYKGFYSNELFKTLRQSEHFLPISIFITHVFQCYTLLRIFSLKDLYCYSMITTSLAKITTPVKEGLL